MIKLSIVIAYYNTYELTEKLLNKLVPQMTRESEIIVVDDGCQESRLDKFKQCKIIHLKKNKGGASAYNIGLDNSKGVYIAFIDCDDMIEDNYISSLLEALENHSEDVIFIGWKDMRTGREVRRPENYAYWKAIYKKNIIPRFRDGWKYAFDVPFYEDLNSKDYSKYYLDKVLYIYNSNRVGSLTWEREEIKRKMIRAKVIKEFTLKDYDSLINVIRVNRNERGRLFVGDEFRCNEDMAKYLSGDNPIKEKVIEILEVIPEKKEEIKEVIKDLEGFDSVNVIPESEKEPKENKKKKKNSKKK